MHRYRFIFTMLVILLIALVGYVEANKWLIIIALAAFIICIVLKVIVNQRQRQ
ncbi:hypothetical protein [Lactobacillus selangorensis]|uniref:hypothetical protein n=1 Tax=Lactobacillus selangorensis TaxID=81857 RepID=UPI000B105E65|nr:hypothetical protein [Lactobacillus selangorensis]